MLSVPELDPILSGAYAAFAAMIEKRVGMSWGVAETALGAPSADDKRYVDFNPPNLSVADPAIGALYATLRQAIVEHNPAVSNALGFSVVDFADLIDGPILRFSSYPGDRARTVNHAHADIDLVTLLPRATVPGLQIFRGGVWQSCGVGANAVALLVGDLAQEFGGPASTSHRVVFSGGCRRLSASFFVNARRELRVRDGSTVADIMNVRLRQVRGEAHE